MSTVSGCSGTSLGDSGTHSDTEDRRVNKINNFLFIIFYSGILK